MTTRVSAVIAAYNHEAYVAEAVLSLIDQVDEVIVVDDHSTDGTLDALRSVRAENLTVLSNDSQMGVSRSFNRAVDAARGAVILIQGGDDRSLPDRAATQIAALDDPEVSLTASLPRVISARGDALPDSVAGEFWSGPGTRDVLAHLFAVGNFICAPAVAVRRADYVKHGGFRAGIDLLQDYLLWLKLAVVGSFDISSNPVVEYRKHGSNLSREYVGLSAPRQRRLDAELQFCRNHFLDSTSREARRRLAADSGLDLRSFDFLSDEEQSAVIRLCHPDKLVVRRGLDFVLEMAGTRNSEEGLARLGLVHADIDRLANVADHESREDVERALGTALRTRHPR